MDFTFTYDKDGQKRRLKGVSHANFAYHSPLLVRWGRGGSSQYGDFHAFEVHGDGSGEYLYKGHNKAISPAIRKAIEDCGDKWVLATAGDNNGDPYFMFEEEDGSPVLPDPAQVAQVTQTAAQVFDAEPVNQAAQQAMAYTPPPQQVASSSPTEAAAARMEHCLQVAASVVKNLQSKGIQLDPEAIRSVGISLFIESKRG